MGYRSFLDDGIGALIYLYLQFAIRGMIRVLGHDILSEVNNLEGCTDDFHSYSTAKDGKNGKKNSSKFPMIPAKTKRRNSITMRKKRVDKCRQQSSPHYKMGIQIIRAPYTLHFSEFLS